MASGSAVPAFLFWTPAQPSLLHTSWPCSPLPSAYEATLSHPANDCGAGLPPWRVVPGFYPGRPSPAEESRRFILDRSLFDLVVTHSCLELTDPRLLSWYLTLSTWDRRIIQGEGGFQQFLKRHPALELSSHHVYVKNNIAVNEPVQPAMMSQHHRSVLTGARMCSCGKTHSELELAIFNNNMKSCEEICHSQQPFHLRDSFQTPHDHPIIQRKAAHDMNEHSVQSQVKTCRPLRETATSSSVLVYSDPAALASFSLDMELERCRQSRKPELRRQMTGGQCGFLTCAEVSPLQSECSLPECSFVHVDGTTYSDGFVRSAELGHVSCPALGPEENNGRCQGHIVFHGDDIVGDDEVNLSLEDQSVNFHSIMVEDQSILVCLACDDDKAPSSKVQSGPVSTDSSETLKPDQSVTSRSAAETSSVSGVHTCDAKVGPEPAPYVSAVTQTDDPQTADKHVITDVHMVDLDYLATGFLKLNTSQEELKKKMKSSGCRWRKACDCIQRTQQAELSLLALQYSMCRQQCWRLHYTSAEGDVSQSWLTDVPASIVSVLQSLESDYNELREKILEGVPLEQLKPLSVDCEKITTSAGSTYTPAKISADVQGNVPSWSSHESERHSTSADKQCPESESTSGCRRILKRVQEEKSDTDRADLVLPRDRATCRELTTSEAWYDAEEDLEPADCAAAEMSLKDDASGSSSKDTKSPVPSVESEVLLSCEKQDASEVSISALENHFSAGSQASFSAVSRPQPAEAALREPLPAENISRPAGGSRSWASEDGTKPQTPRPGPYGTEAKPPVCISPEAKGTCVPQQYGTMGSFDTLMAELTQHHPDVGMQKIVDVLLQLSAKQQGVLGGLPLQTISEMASELLTGPATQL